jgi:tetratricopeptide (TPR) repeat protein
MGELEKARLLIEKSLTDYTDQQRGEFLHLQGEVYYHLGNYIKAAESFREAMQQSEKDWDQLQEHLSDKESMINATLQEQPVYRQSKARLDQITFLTTGEAEAERGQIRGEILNENTPVSGVMVYLISEKDYDGRTNGFGTMEYGYPSQTDELGRFTFDPIAPGKYFIVLGVKPADLEGVGRFKGLESFGVEAGKITELKYVFKPRVIISEPAGEQMYSPEQGLRITWETVPQAFSYNLHITLKLENGYVSRVYRKNLKGNSYLFSPQGLALRDMNFVARGDRMVLSPSAILGSFYPGAEIYFVVEALDELGRSISDSEGYILQLDGNYPSVQIQDSGRLSRGDQFVIEQKFEEALDAYLALFQENPNDPETLLSLARLYSYGWTEGTSDPVKAVEYYRKLLDVDRAEFIVSEAASAAVQADNDDLALSLFEEIENCFEAHSFWFHLMGELYFKKGEIDQALDYYLKYLNGQNEFRDLGPVAVLLYKGDLNQAITLLQGKDYSQRSRYSSEGQTAEPADIRTILQNIQQYQQGAKSVLSRNEMNRLLLEIIQINGSQRFEKVKVFQEKVLRLGENDVLVNVLIELAKDRR